jgi:SulP family sulfate permease
MKRILQTLFPLTESFGSYTLQKSKADITAGLLVGIVLVPQAMGYAMLAGLPPVIGLYASTLPLLVYALTGSSRHLAVGPVAMISLLVFASCSQLASPGSQQYVQITTIMAGISGLMLLILGIIRAGFLINLISDSVIHGFTSAAAIIIAVSQVTHLCGFEVSREGSPLLTIFRIIAKLPEIHLATFGIGMLCILVLLITRKFLPRGVGPFLVVIVSVLTVLFLRLDKTGVAVVGIVPQGLPSLAIPELDVSSLRTLLPGALSITFIGYIESIAVAKLIASKRGYIIDPSRELIALGLSNITAFLFSGYPVTGGFSRSAVNDDAGAQTGIASVVTAVIVLLTLLLLTPVFYYLPKATLASIVIVSVVKLVDLQEGIHLYKIHTADGIAFAVAFIATLGIGVEPGIIIGVAFCLLVFFWRASHPHITELGYVPEEKTFGDITRYPNAHQWESLLFIRVEGPMFFANVKFLEDHIEILTQKRKKLERIILDMSAVFCIDAAAIKRLEKIIEQFFYRNITISLAHIRDEIRETLKLAGWQEKPWFEKFYISHEELLHEYDRSS